MSEVEKGDVSVKCDYKLLSSVVVLERNEYTTNNTKYEKKTLIYNLNLTIFCSNI